MGATGIELTPEQIASRRKSAKLFYQLHKDSPERREDKNQRQKIYYYRHREEICKKSAERRKANPPEYKPNEEVFFTDNPDREKIIQAIAEEAGSEESVVLYK